MTTSTSLSDNVEVWSTSLNSRKRTFSNHRKFGLSMIRPLVAKGVRCHAPAGTVFMVYTGMAAISVALATQACLAMV